MTMSVTENHQKPIAARTKMLDKSGDRVRQMFAEIAPRYDLMNHLLSLNIDKNAADSRSEGWIARFGCLHWHRRFGDRNGQFPRNGNQNCGERLLQRNAPNRAEKTSQIVA
jgi:hypothetical protein